MTDRNGFLYIFGGLPGTGKTTVARALAARISAVYLRIDTLEQALVNAGLCAMDEIGGAGYEAAYALAADNLRLGAAVVADSVNPLDITRAAWRRAADGAAAGRLEIEVVCTDAGEHRRRVETRAVDIPGLIPPTWRQVRERFYEPWTTRPLVLDTARLSAAEAVEAILAHSAMMGGAAR